MPNKFIDEDLQYITIRDKNGKIIDPERDSRKTEETGEKPKKARS